MKGVSIHNDHTQPFPGRLTSQFGLKLILADLKWINVDFNAANNDDPITERFFRANAETVVGELGIPMEEWMALWTAVSRGGKKTHVDAELFQKHVWELLRRGKLEPLAENAIVKLLQKGMCSTSAIPMDKKADAQSWEDFIRGEIRRVESDISYARNFRGGDMRRWMYGFLNFVVYSRDTLALGRAHQLLRYFLNFVMSHVGSDQIINITCRIASLIAHKYQRVKASVITEALEAALLKEHFRRSCSFSIVHCFHALFRHCEMPDASILKFFQRLWEKDRDVRKRDLCAYFGIYVLMAKRLFDPPKKDKDKEFIEEWFNLVRTALSSPQEGHRVWVMKAYRMVKTLAPIEAKKLLKGLSQVYRETQKGRKTFTKWMERMSSQDKKHRKDAAKSTSQIRGTSEMRYACFWDQTSAHVYGVTTEALSDLCPDLPNNYPNYLGVTPKVGSADLQKKKEARALEQEMLEHDKERRRLLKKKKKRKKKRKRKGAMAGLLPDEDEEEEEESEGLAERMGDDDLMTTGGGGLYEGGQADTGGRHDLFDSSEDDSEEKRREEEAHTKMVEETRTREEAVEHERTVFYAEGDDELMTMANPYVSAMFSKVNETRLVVGWGFKELCRFLVLLRLPGLSKENIVEYLDPFMNGLLFLNVCKVQKRVYLKNLEMTGIKWPPDFASSVYTASLRLWNRYFVENAQSRCGRLIVEIDDMKNEMENMREYLSSIGVEVDEKDSDKYIHNTLVMPYVFDRLHREDELYPRWSREDENDWFSLKGELEKLWRKATALEDTLRAQQYLQSFYARDLRAIYCRIRTKQKSLHKLLKKMQHLESKFRGLEKRQRRYETQTKELWDARKALDEDMCEAQAELEADGRWQTVLELEELNAETEKLRAMDRRLTAVKTSMYRSVAKFTTLFRASERSVFRHCRTDKRDTATGKGARDFQRAMLIPGMDELAKDFDYFFEKVICAESGSLSIDQMADLIFHDSLDSWKPVPESVTKKTRELMAEKARRSRAEVVGQSERCRVEGRERRERFEKGKAQAKARAKATLDKAKDSEAEATRKAATAKTQSVRHRRAMSYGLQASAMPFEGDVKRKSTTG